jgi:hypothetical protein
MSKPDPLDVDSQFSHGMETITVSVVDESRCEFEQEIFSYYCDLKSKGWSAPQEGDQTREALCWRHPNGRYGVNQVEAAWNGWEMRRKAHG